MTIFNDITQQHPFYNRVGQLDGNGKLFRMPEDVGRVLGRLENNVLGDVIVLPLNCGSLYVGWSQEAAKWKALNYRQLPSLLCKSLV